MKGFCVYLLLASVLILGCASGNSTQVMATIGGLNAGSTLGGAIGGLASGSSRGYFMGTTIGALSGAAIGAVATAPRGNSSSATAKRSNKRSSTPPPVAGLSGLNRDVRVTNVRFSDASGDGVLQRGEAATISYDIINVTPSYIKLLIPKIELTKQAAKIQISPMQSITDIAPAEGVRYTVTLTADKKLKSSGTSAVLYLSADGGKSYMEMNSLQFRTKK